MCEGHRSRVVVQAPSGPLPGRCRRDGAGRDRTAHADGDQGSGDPAHVGTVKVLLLATGGTIASKVQPDGGVAVALTGRQLLETVPDIDVADIEVFDVVHGPSWNFDIPTMTSIARRVHDAFGDA